MRKCYVLFREDVTHGTKDMQIYTSIRKARLNQAEWIKKMDFLGIETISKIKIYVLQ